MKLVISSTNRVPDELPFKNLNYIDSFETETTNLADLSIQDQKHIDKILNETVTNKKGYIRTLLYSEKAILLDFGSWTKFLVVELK